VKATLNLLSFILQHPLNRARRGAALIRLVRWQLGSRLLPGAVACPFVGSTRLLVQPGMTGATQNIYCGLHEFEDMALVLHALRPGDLFADVGANVGAYTVLAAGSSGARCLAIEPHPATFTHLLDNIRLNDLERRVTAKNIGAGARADVRTFTSGLDSANHVVAETELAADTIRVPIEPLDDLISGESLVAMKVDVEGFETDVLDGASGCLQSPSLLAVIMELNGSGARYGYDENAIHARMLNWGFRPARYDPYQRTITLVACRDASGGNVLYVRNVELLRERVRTAPKYAVLGSSL
jgi:FkbM family methyltransferase